jgi:hypothetical protein
VEAISLRFAENVTKQLFDLKRRVYLSVSLDLDAASLDLFPLSIGALASYCLDMVCSFNRFGPPIFFLIR